MTGTASDNIVFVVRFTRPDYSMNLTPFGNFRNFTLYAAILPNS